MAKETSNATNGAMYNALTLGTKITGKIEAEGDFRVDGEVEGDIICNGKVLIGQKAVINGTITCANAEIAGTVKGTINVSELLSLHATSIVLGEINTKIFVVQPNATFNGTCSMKQNKTFETISEKKKKDAE